MTWISGVSDFYSWNGMGSATMTSPLTFTSSNYTGPVLVNGDCVFNGNRLQIIVDSSITAWKGLFIPVSGMINITNVTISMTTFVADNFGGIIGDCSGRSGYILTVNTCSVTGSYTIGQNIAGNDGSGGICGRLCTATIKNCYTTGDLSNSSNVKYAYGGITGPLFTGSIISCFTTGNDLDNNGIANGLISTVFLNNLLVVNCYSLGTIGHGGSGISIAWCNNGSTITIVNCYSSGNITYSYSAGIMMVFLDLVASSVTASVYNCYSLGSVSSMACGGITCNGYGPFLQNCYSLQATNIGVLTSGSPNDKYTADTVGQITADGVYYFTPTGTHTIGVGNTTTWPNSPNDPISLGYLTNNITVNGTIYNDIWVNNNGSPPMLSSFVQNPWNHTSYSDTSGFVGPICFLKGTKVLSNGIYKNVENLNQHDKVDTFGILINKNFNGYNGGINFIKRISYLKIENPSIADYPVCIKKNALGIDLPNNDVYVSQNHKILYNGEMIKAKKLVKKINNNDKIFIDQSITNIEYYHILTRRHHLVNCSGLYCETLKDPNKVVNNTD